MTFHFAPDPGLRGRPPGLQSRQGAHAGRLRAVLRLLPLLLPVGLVAMRRGGRLRQALDRSARALQEAEERFHTLLNQAPVGICQTDLAGRYLLANDRYCGLVGRRMDTLRLLRMHDLTHPDDLGRHQASHARMLSTGEPFAIEKRLVRPDETDVWVVSHVSLTHDAHGQPLHVIAAVQDISHRRAAEAALHAMNATLEQRVADAVAERARVEESLRQSQRMEALGQLAGGVAHDFNNVLQAIAGGARLIQRRPDNPDSVRRLAGLVVDAADRGASVTRRLLSFARRGALEPGPVDATGLLNDLQEMLSRTLGTGITVQASAEPGLPPMLADKGGLETVLVNLATNARDAMLDDAGLPGPGPNHVVMRAAADDGAAAGLPAGRYVRLDVSDTGAGMDGDTLAHAAEPFFTTKPRGRGTGLGLPVARGFAEQSGGALRLTSAPGQGTTVQLWLPAMPAAATGTAAGRPCAVLVDDDPEVRDIMADTLGGPRLPGVHPLGRWVRAGAAVRGSARRAHQRPVHARHRWHDPDPPGPDPAAGPARHPADRPFRAGAGGGGRQGHRRARAVGAEAGAGRALVAHIRTLLPEGLDLHA